MDDGLSLEDVIGKNVDVRLSNLESIIKTDGDGAYYLSDDGTYKEL